jgi:DNA-binding NarL/FixJ family response regulator
MPAAAQTELMGIPHHNAATGGPLAPQRIFLVEDSPLIRDSLIDMLDDVEGGRMVIGTADTEQAAVERITDMGPDVAIIDINLREGSGIGVLERLSHLDSAPAVRIVYTNLSDGRTHRHCRELGATHVISKGGDAHELIDALAAAPH